MRRHFPMNLHGKQIGHVLGYIPGALYMQAVLQGMSRAYQGVLEEANRRYLRLHCGSCGVPEKEKSLYSPVVFKKEVQKKKKTYL